MKLRSILTTMLSGVIALSSSAAIAGKLDDIREQGYIRIGVSLGGEPIGFRNQKNEPVGYDVDLAYRLAEKLGVEARFTDVHGDARVSMLFSDQLDAVIGNMSATLERAKSVNFSIPYARAGLRIIHQKEMAINSLADLKGKKVVVGRGSTGETFLKREVPEATLVYTDNFAPDGILLLRQGRVDAGIEDSSLIDYLATQTDRLETLPGLLSNDPIGVGIRKGDQEFLRWMDMFVSEYISSGDYETSYKKWWGADANPPTLKPIW
ncbi:transporter substrate-binding domain-containing protein [Vibrio sp. VB16]|uniref:transporter substrate-binding domain-containing protein n=1 Tax=Vibrio sp. VB16 TaxID=2785746 RepID=UPI00189C7317|nr:transporter substrate-binding domain-containing protein [Vibrio sp. VB16]UGA56985.1 transporter substrate-binding domain-containing protein [Vibrio sp. VB16]